MIYKMKDAAGGGDQQEEDSKIEMRTDNLCDGYLIIENGIDDDSENRRNTKDFAAKSKAAAPKEANEDSQKEVPRKTSVYGTGILDQFTERWVECQKHTEIGRAHV